MVLLLALAMGAGSPVLGDWKGPTGSVVRVYECGSAVCLKLVNLPPDAPVKVDGHNPDKALQSRPLCGMEIGSGFQQDDPTHLSGGHVYDPISGKTYKGKIEREGDKLKLRGYIGVSLFGRTETWVKVAPVAVCR